MDFFGYEAYEIPCLKVLIPNQEVSDILDELGFERQGGTMSLYNERYCDVDKLMSEIESYFGEDNPTANLIWEFAEKVGDGTIIFYDE